MRVAYICTPEVGGTFTFFQRLRPELAKLGVDFRCVSPISAHKFTGSRFANLEGVDYIELPDDPAAATSALLAHLRASAYELAMCLPTGDVLTKNLPRYIPREIRCVSRVPMMTRGAYVPVKAVAAHLDLILSVSDRIADDLRTGYGIPADKVRTIYHGMDPAMFADAANKTPSSGPLRLLYVGRLWDLDKGVFLIPPILEEMRKRNVDFHLTIAGSGPDGDELKQRIASSGLAVRATFEGAVPFEKLGGLYKNADIFLLPSRFEGFGFAALEAMSAGCAPVVSNIRGSLSVIIEDGISGRLARVGDSASFAAAIAELAADRSALAKMQAASRVRVLEKFTMEKMSANYAAAFRDVLAAHDQRSAPLDPARYEIPRELKPTWRTLVPHPLKNLARTWLERMGKSA